MTDNPSRTFSTEGKMPDFASSDIALPTLRRSLCTVCICSAAIVMLAEARRLIEQAGTSQSTANTKKGRGWRDGLKIA